MAEQPSGPPTLIIGDFASRCGVCGKGADPDEKQHTRVLGMGRAGGEGCGAVWTHVRADVTSRIGAGRRIREMRPDLELIGGDR